MDTKHYKLFNTNQEWIKTNCIYLTIHGSKCYGTNIETSDTDYRGIVIPPREFYLGYQKNFENYIQNEPNDLTVFELKKFLRLALENNPNVLEILYTEPEDHIYIHPKYGQKILDNKHMFLSKKAKHTFSGYAVSQLKRIKRHREWIMNPPKSPPTRKELGLPETPLIPKSQIEAISSAIHKQIDKWNWHELENVEVSVRQCIKDQFETNMCEIMQWHWSDLDDKIWHSAAKQIGLDTNFIEIMAKERTFSGKTKEWQQYQDWKKNRNPERAKMEEESGFDRKHALHLIRLLRMCKEIMELGKLIVKRPDAEELISIRRGAWSYEKLIDYAENIEKEINALYLTSKAVPEKPNYEAIEKLCIELIEDSLKL